MTRLATIFTAGFFAVLIAVTAPVSAQTDLSGPLTGTLTFDDSPYRVLDDSVYVPYGDTLIVEAGVEINFYPDHGLWVDGTLLVNGGEGDSVVFRANISGTPGAWIGIIFNGVGASSSVVNTAKIEYARDNIFVVSSGPEFNGVHSHGASRNGVRVDGGAPVFNDLLISQQPGQQCESAFAASNAVPVWNGGKIKGVRPLGSHGIKLVSGTMAVIDGVEIRDVNDSGIYAEDCPNGTLTNNFIEDVGLRGISLDDCNSFNISYNLLNRITGPGVYVNNGNHTGYRRGIHHNTIRQAGYNNDARDGIFIGGNNTSVQIHSNIVTESSGYGIRSATVQVTSYYSCYWDNGDLGNYGGNAIAGTGDIEENPQLFGFDYELSAGSPCIDTGDPSFEDPDGTRGDMGYRFYNQNHTPIIDDWTPESLSLTGYSWGDVVDFSVSAHDPDENPLDYRWYYHGELQSTSTEASIELVGVEDDSIYVEVDDGYYDGLVRKVWHIIDLSVAEGNAEVPREFALLGVYPNPFNPTGTVRFAVPSPGIVKVRVFDLLGREVYGHDETFSAGTHTLAVGDRAWSSGVYFVRLSWGAKTSVGKIVLLR